MTRPQHLLMRSAIALIPAVTLSYIACQYWWPTRYLVLAATGRTRCSWAQTRESESAEAARLHKMAANAARSRVIKRDGALALWNTPDGDWWYPTRGDLPTESLMAGRTLLVRWRKIEGVPEPPVRTGDIVLDCGGHIGQSAKTALLLGAKLVVTVEPDPDNVECIHRNLAAEIEGGQVVVCPKGVWDAPGHFHLNRGLHSADGTVSERGIVPVELVTIDALVEELQLGRVDFIKMDIEGAERNAIAGARQTIQRYHPRMAIGSYHRSDDYDVLPPLVHGIHGDYRVACGRCLPAYGRVIPNLLYFH